MTREATRPEDALWPRLIVRRVSVDLMDEETALALITEASGDEPIAVASANLDHIYHFANRNKGLDDATSSDDPHPQWFTLLDGMPLVRVANTRTGQRWHRLSGSDLIDPILERAVEKDLSVGFLGGSAQTHTELRRALASRHPAAKLAGTWAPSRAELLDAAASARIASEIRDSHTDILVVCLGKPLQEDWIQRYGVATGASSLLAFGAVVDFLAGRVRRAPSFVSNAGAEWAWRLMLEPRRLGRRYMIQGPQALFELRRDARVA